MIMYNFIAFNFTDSLISKVTQVRDSPAPLSLIKLPYTFLIQLGYSHIMHSIWNELFQIDIH